MTAQIDDVFLLNGVEYSLAGISEGELFDPELLDIKPVGTCTACYRGYQAIFGLHGDRLVLQTLHANLISNVEPYNDLVGPAINGVVPSGPREQHDDFNNHYADINYHLEYSGGLLLADDFIQELYVHMGFHPAWKYRTVRELLFEGGRLIADLDHSASMAELRDSIVEEGQFADALEFPSQQQVEEFIERAFDRRYRL